MIRTYDQNGESLQTLEGKKMVTLADLKKNRSTDFSKLTKALENSDSQNKGADDSQFWKLERDKAGNGSATIRFLPAFQGEGATEADELPWVKVYSHSFQGPSGRWYIENCLSTIGQDDPVNDLNRKLWAGSDKDKEQARLQKRKLTYIAQILVVSDPKHPENNGKVFYFKFGKKIFDKIMDAAKPTFEDEKPVNVFDFWEGADFKLRIKTVDKFPNYDSSAFESPKPIADSDEEILEIAKMQKSLGQFVAVENFKSYADLEKKLNAVLSEQQGSAKKAEDVAKEMREQIASAAKEPQKPVEPQSHITREVSPDDDDMEAFFKSIED